MTHKRTSADQNVNTTGLKSLNRLGRDPRVDEIYKDEDGIWMYLTTGFESDPKSSCHTLHEYTVSELIKSARYICRCDCADCTAPIPHAEVTA